MRKKKPFVAEHISGHQFMVWARFKKGSFLLGRAPTTLTFTFGEQFRYEKKGTAWREAPETLKARTDHRNFLFDVIDEAEFELERLGYSQDVWKKANPREFDRYFFVKERAPDEFKAHYFCQTAAMARALLDNPKLDSELFFLILSLGEAAKVTEGFHNPRNFSQKQSLKGSKRKGKTFSPFKPLLRHLVEGLAKGGQEYSANALFGFFVDEAAGKTSPLSKLFPDSGRIRVVKVHVVDSQYSFAEFEIDGGRKVLKYTRTQNLVAEAKKVLHIA